MFTGIVQGVGKLVAIERECADFRTHAVALPEDMAHDLRVGASVANNGCCLTITRVAQNVVYFDLMAETIKRTNLGCLKVGEGLNLERAARFGDEIGGHVMSGHVMGCTHITKIERTEWNQTVWFDLPCEIAPYVLHKGFIGLDGCSLTIGQVCASEYFVHLIPETLQRTMYATRRVGDKINVEVDAQTHVIVDTVQRVLSQRDAA